MKHHLLAISFVLVHLLAHAQQVGNPVHPLATATPGIVIGDSPTCYLDSVNTTRGGSIQDIATVRDKTFDVSWPWFYDRLMTDPRPYVFWLQAGLRNDGDTAQELSLAYGNLDFVDAWLIPTRSAPKPSGLPQYVSAGDLRPPPVHASYLQQRSRTIPLRLPPHTSATLLIRVRQLTDDYSFDGFALYDQASLSAGIVKDLPADNAFLVIQMLFQGFLLCQLLYVLVQWFIIRRPEYMYYFLYMLLIAGYFLSKQESLFGVRMLFTRWPLLWARRC